MSGGTLASIVVAAALLLWLFIRGLWSLVLRAGPDEWLLQIRDGALVRAGVGITAIRWPQDRVVRFPASVQRVRFRADVLSSELLPVTIEAFALWSVLPEDPLLAARRLGLASERYGREQHLLSRAQYHAFQQAFASMVRGHAGKLALSELCRDPAPLADAVLREAVQQLAPLGARVEGVSVIEARPAESSLLSRLSAEVDEEITRRAARSRGETVREQSRIDQAAEIEREQGRIANERALSEAREALAALERQREDIALQASIAQGRRRAEADAENLRILARAESERTPELRSHELERLKTETLGHTLSAWPVREAHWVGLEGPIASLERALGGGMFGSRRERGAS